VFKALFTDEDTADLILENPENLAETGIDIVAKPKGKRPSSITQLSGGEKNLNGDGIALRHLTSSNLPHSVYWMR